jgi:quercetin dioxygenase-like cupin family protein
MNSEITTLDPVSSTVHSKTILSKQGFACSLIMLAPGDETPPRESDQVEEHILFVVDGVATVRFEDVNTILSKDEALLIPKGKPHTIVASPAGWAKILRVDVPPRQVVTPQIISFDHR